MTAPAIPDGPIEQPPVGFVLTDDQAQLLRDTLSAAGVQLGAYDEQIVAWLAMWDWSTLAVILAWIRQAGAARE